MLNALQINKKYCTLSTFPSSNRRNFEDSGSDGRFCIGNLPEYCSSALSAHAYEMVITTVCVQIDNVCVIRDFLSISVHVSPR